MAAIGSDFITEVRKTNIRCSECGGWIGAGATCLVSIRKGKVQKRVRGEDCRLDFDARYWAEVARQNR
jgi:hypothetical protein